MYIQPIGLLTDAITMATKIEDKIDRKRLKNPIRRTPWDKSVTAKFFTFDSGKVGAASTSTAPKPTDDIAKPPPKPAEAVAKKGAN